MISKRKLINALFVLGFPFYGLGTYVSFKNNFSMGLMVSVMPWLAIITIYIIDVLYRKTLKNVVNSTYWLAIVFLLSLVASMWVSYANNFPGLNLVNTLAYSVLFLVPINASVIVNIYNKKNADYDIARMILIGLSILIIVNFIGFFGGLRNLVHGFEGRINLPFMRGIYDASHLLSIINLMLLYYIRNFKENPLKYILLCVFYIFNLIVMLDINSRLSLMIFIIFTVVFISRMARNVKGLFTISLFTMPLMMSFSVLIYQILSLPFFQSIMQRVSEEDVTTFNGRTYIWTSMADWALDDRTGFLFGNGYHGQYQLRMLDFLAILWGADARDSYNLHLHSTFLEITMDQGIFGLILFYILMYRCYKFYRKRYRSNLKEGPIFAALVYLMFIWQIDIFCYGIDIGNPIFFCMLSIVAVRSGYLYQEGNKELKPA